MSERGVPYVKGIQCEIICKTCDNYCSNGNTNLLEDPFEFIYILEELGWSKIKFGDKICWVCNNCFDRDCMKYGNNR